MYAFAFIKYKIETNIDTCHLGLAYTEQIRQCNNRNYSANPAVKAAKIPPTVPIKRISKIRTPEDSLPSLDSMKMSMCSY